MFVPSFSSLGSLEACGGSSLSIVQSEATGDVVMPAVVRRPPPRVVRIQSFCKSIVRDAQSPPNIRGYGGSLRGMWGPNVRTSWQQGVEGMTCSGAF
eukprot:2574941-Amphidinium_carterae.1